MKKSAFITIILVVVIIQSCHKPGYLDVSNNISGVKIEQVYWGDHYISGSIYPGEKSNLRELTHWDEELPASFPLRFKMYANGKTVYLETEESFRLDEEETLHINLGDSTRVKNP